MGESLRIGANSSPLVPGSTPSTPGGGADCMQIPPSRYNGHSAHFLAGELKALPLYAYRCTQCGHRFEKIQNFSAAQELVCPVCQGVLERPLTAPRLHFKGAGFYINDYAAKSSAPAAESVPATGTEAAPAGAKTPCGGDCGAACPAVAAAATDSKATSTAS